MAPSVFWGALLFGRLITPVVLRKLSADRIVLAGLLIALVGTGMILGFSTYSLLLVAVVLCGFGLAPVFPTTIARFSERLGPAASGVAGMVFAMSAIGGATIPGLVGKVSTVVGSLRAALLIPAIASALMIALQLGLTVQSIQKDDMNTRVKPSH
jgi:fucose permease